MATLLQEFVTAAKNVSSADYFVNFIFNSIKIVLSDESATCFKVPFVSTTEFHLCAGISSPFYAANSLDEWGTTILHFIIFSLNLFAQHLTVNKSQGYAAEKMASSCWGRLPSAVLPPSPQGGPGKHAMVWLVNHSPTPLCISCLSSCGFSDLLKYVPFPHTLGRALLCSVFNDCMVKVYIYIYSLQNILRSISRQLFSAVNLCPPNALC